MKYLLIHSYSDFNKGDAAIIISTVRGIRNKDSSAKIILYSTYGHKDPQFHEQHNILREYVDDILPAIMPELSMEIFGRRFYGTFAKFISLPYQLFKSLLTLVFRNNFLLSTEEKKSINAFQETDLVISKGGSFLCSFGSIRELIVLYRMLHPIFLAKSLSKRTIIFGQSLGPFNDFFSAYLFKQSLRCIDYVYVREKYCLDLLHKANIEIDKLKLRHVPDLAFVLEAESKHIDFQNLINSCDHHTGMTIVDHNFSNSDLRKNYIEAVSKGIEHLIEELNSNIIIYPQVISVLPDGTEDVKLARTIRETLSDRAKGKVTILEGNYTPGQLKGMYGEMNLFIATRLHSSIFSTACRVPTINISYHGTKSRGTFELIDMENYIIDIENINRATLVNKIIEITSKEDEVRRTLDLNMKQIEMDIDSALSEICRFD